MKIKTSIFQQMVGTAVKVCSFNKMLPLTSLMEIKTDKEGMTLITTDTVTTFEYRLGMEGLEESNVVVDANVISALAQKITTPEMELTVTGNSLIISGNGVYNIPIRVDESGNVIELPKITVPNSQPEHVNLQRIREMIKVCSASVSPTVEAKELNNYYLGKDAVTTDQIKVTVLQDTGLGLKKPLFLKASAADIISATTFVEADLYTLEDKVYLIGKTFKFEIAVDNGDLEYFTNGALKYVDKNKDVKYDYSIKLHKSNVLDVLDRLGLFIGDYDSKAVYFHVSKNNLEIHNKDKSSHETLSFLEENLGDDFKEEEFILNIEWTKQLLNVLPEDTFTLSFNANARNVKINNANITQIISTLQEEM